MQGADGERARGAPWPVRLATDWRVQLVLAAAALVLAAVVGAALGQRRPAPRASASGVPSTMPEAFPIGDSWRAAAAGDAEAYLGCFTHEARDALAARLSRLGREAFRRELRAAAEAALGIEWGPPQPAPDGGLRLPVSVLRSDGVEAFDYVVVKVGANWRIRSVARSGRQVAAPPVTERVGPPAKEGGDR